jgi:hypothetical protein
VGHVPNQYLFGKVSISFSLFDFSEVDAEKADGDFELPRHRLKNFLTEQFLFVVKRKNVPARKF